MKIGDLVICQRHHPLPPVKGPIVGFNKKGEGGKEYVHILIDGKIEVFMRFMVEILNKGNCGLER